MPASKVQLFHDNTAPLIHELVHDHLDAAIVSLPVTDENFESRSLGETGLLYVSQPIILLQRSSL